MDIYDAWNASLEDIKNRVTGVGVWTALNVAIPITVEDGQLVIGFRQQDQDLIGHLKTPGTQRIIEEEMQKRLKEKVKVFLLNGVTINDWEAFKRIKAEATKTKTKEFERTRRDTEAARQWDGVYDNLSRIYSAISNKNLPQQRARFMAQAIDLVARQVSSQELDEFGERNLARCLERISQYCEVPPPLIALRVLEKAGQI
ncbi:MAG: hypothetical protein KIT74_06030 [Fimbriimonadales bacterium]|nr:hypothetical protein [Fimbriimonadales bacterium]